MQAAHRAPERAQQRSACGGWRVEEEAHGPHDGGAPAALRLLQHRRQAGAAERHPGREMSFRGSQLFLLFLLLLQLFS